LEILCTTRPILQDENKTERLCRDENEETLMVTQSTIERGPIKRVERGEKIGKKNGYAEEMQGPS